MGFLALGCTSGGELCPHDPAEGTLEIHSLEPANPTLNGSLQVTFCGDFINDNMFYWMTYWVERADGSLVGLDSTQVQSNYQEVVVLGITGNLYENNRIYYVKAKLLETNGTTINATPKQFTIGAVPTVRPECIGTNTRTLIVEYDYMIDSAHNNLSMGLNTTGAYLTSAYYDKCNVNFNFGNPTVNPYQIIYTGPNSNPQIAQFLNEYRDENGPNFINWQRGYLVGIDSVTTSPPSHYSVFGYSNSTPNFDNPRYSFILTGKIRRRFPNNIDNYRNWVTAHELGHQIGIRGHEGHGGNDMGCCVMWDSLVPGCNNIVFCDNHACVLYDTLENSRDEEAGSISGNSDNIEISINTIKNSYVEGEPIWVNVVYKNTGSKIDSFSNYYDDEVDQNIIMKNNLGIKMDFKGLIACRMEGKSFLKLKPNESKTYSINLSYGFGYMPESNQPMAPQFYFPADRYSIRSFNEEPLLKRYIESNNILIEVVKPDYNEKIALTKLREIYNLPTKGKDKKLNKLEAYKGFLYNNPNSVYYEQAFQYYTMLFNLLAHKEAYPYSQQTVQESLDFIQKYPNSYYTLDAVWFGKEAAFSIGKSNAKDFLQKVISEYSRYKAGDIARELYKQY